MFWYSSILAYLFFFFQVDKFVFSMQKMDGDGRPQVVTAWTSLLKHNSTEFNFKDFIDQFYHPVVSMLSRKPEPRINDEVQRILHLSDHTKKIDWYLYQNHIEIRVSGCTLAPYKLPKYLPVRIFSLEYIRHMINSDDIHFVSVKKMQQLRIKGQIGSFICNNHSAREEANRLLKEMKFFLSFPWHYDPCGIIFEMRLKNENIPYVHEYGPEVEKFANHTVWEPNIWLKQNNRIPRSLYRKQPHNRFRKRKGLGNIYLHLSLRCRRKNSNCIPRSLKPFQLLTRLGKRKSRLLQ
jgi:hypothetical protein